MNDHPIGDMMSQTMQKIRDLVEANTIIGTPITTPDGVTLIPVSKMTMGFGCGGSDFKSRGQEAQTQPIMFGGGSGAGVNITPVAFIIINGENVRLLPVASPANTAVDRVVDLVPDVIDKVSALINKGKPASDNE